MAKKILVVGGGGREHAIIKALKKSPDCGEIWCAPGNGGISYDAKCKNIKATDVETMVAFAAEEKFDYVVVAQDDPLALGAVDALTAAGVPCFGPDAKAAVIEASKAFSKELMHKYNIPTARYAVFPDPAAACASIRNFATKLLSLQNSSFNILIATRRLSFLSLALYTYAMPPEPICSRISYLLLRIVPVRIILSSITLWVLLH